jgi:hypothetical protein
MIMSWKRGQSRLAVLSLVLAALISTAFGLVAAPAHAISPEDFIRARATADALSRCRNLQHDDRSAQVTVPGKGTAFVGGGPFQSTAPLRGQIAPGDVVGVFATGQVSYGGLFGSAGTWGPNGNGSTAPLNSAYPFPGGPQYALIGTWNHTGGDVRIGSQSECMVVPTGGDGASVPWGLWLIPNDDGPLDNGGSYTVTVHVWHADTVLDGSFESQQSGSVGVPWGTEGSDWKGIDINLGLAQSGRNNAFTWSTGRNWNAIVQTVPVVPNADYVLTGWVRTSGRVNTGFFGARLSGVWPPPGEAHFGYTGANYQQLTVRFNSTNHTTATVFCGLWGVDTPGGDWIQMDNISLQRA